jgi:hypothetical protein
VHKAGDLNTPVGLSDAVLADITTTWEGLSKGRKKRPLPEGLPSPEEVRNEEGGEGRREGWRDGGMNVFSLLLFFL